MFDWVKTRDGHDNFFTPIRFILAYLVLIGHSFVVVGGGSEAEPQIFYHYTFSYMAVNLFFIASGFLVTGSMLYRKSLANFASARILRIYPALIVHVFLVMLVFGLLTTSLPWRDYLTNMDVWKQPFLVLPFIETEMALPGIVPNNAEHMASASLWTLRYELLAYIGTFIAYSLGLMKSARIVLLQFLAFAVLVPIAYVSGIYEQLPATIQAILRFGLCYGLGAAIYVYRDKIKFHILGIPVLTALTVLLSKTPLFEVMGVMAAGYALMWAAYVKLPKLDFLKKFSDISYGIYIYHWTVLQALYHFMPGLNVWQLMVLGTPITIIIAWASWHWIEAPALKLKGKFGQKLSFGKKQPALNL